jgi:pSer/pThr/pTyr-binding forkhead associated (FHA) protein
VHRPDRAYFHEVQAQEGPDAAAIPFPAYCPERRFSLTGEQIRIGRLSRTRGVVPEIDLTGPPADPGVSHLHAVLLAQPGGGWAVVDPGSTNGTTLNDDPEPIGNDVAVPVGDGERIHIGAWTTITVHAPAGG